MNENPYQSTFVEEYDNILTLEMIILFPFVTVLSLFLITPLEAIYHWIRGRKKSSELFDILGYTIWCYTMIFCEILHLFVHFGRGD